MEGDEESAKNSLSACSSAACPTPARGTPQSIPTQTNGHCGLEKPHVDPCKGRQRGTGQAEVTARRQQPGKQRAISKS